MPVECIMAVKRWSVGHGILLRVAVSESNASVLERLPSGNRSSRMSGFNTMLTCYSCHLIGCWHV